ncbi:MAG: site-2 protease family protein, partial [Thermodesulfobacteriota bacterium]
ADRTRLNQPMVLRGKIYIVLWLAVPGLFGLLHHLFRDAARGAGWLNTGLSIYVLFLSVVVHELSHGATAFFRGDDTALRAGRLTLNPFGHISLVGTIIVPLVLYLAKFQAVLGWARPVPFNPAKLRAYPKDQVLVALAGPFSNFVLALAGFTLYLAAKTAYLHLHPGAAFLLNMFIVKTGFLHHLPQASFWFVLFKLLALVVLINLLLGVFNLIPFPPLDGSWLLQYLLPPKITAVLTRSPLTGLILLLLAVNLGLLDVFFYPVYLVLYLFQGLEVLIFPG